eukprot:scaffold76402_cov33-Tisochrysis_lutea.AAC.1
MGVRTARRTAGGALRRMRRVLDARVQFKRSCVTTTKCSSCWHHLLGHKVCWRRIAGARASGAR